MKIGAQLFSVRSFCTTLEDLGETLRRVADIGYTSVQVSGTCAYTAEQLRPLLEAAGVTCDLTHYAYDKIVGETAATMAEHRAFGCENIGIGSMPGLFVPEPDVAGAARLFVERTRPAARAVADGGMRLCYHNHAKEYETRVGDATVMEYLSDAFAPRELHFTLDTHWVARGGYDPVAEIRRLSGRLHCVHLKDLEAGTGRFAPVGSGVLDFPAILAALEDAGTAFAFVEQDDCYGEDPFVCLRKSFDYLRAQGLC